MATSTQIKLTFDTDDGRPNSSPSCVVDASGRMSVFYGKTLLSGRTSDTRVTIDDPTPTFNVYVQAGSGTLNGTPVSWGAVTLIMPPDTFQVIYVTSGGVVSYISDLTMSIMASSIVLAFVYVGVSAITLLEEVEKTGRYVYVRHQILSGSTWVWDNNEYILNTGEQPKAFYNSATDKIYLSYKKDSISYLRVIDTTNPLTWSYLPNISIQTGPTINLNNNPQSTLYFKSSAGYESTFSTFTTPKLYTLNYTALKFIPVLSVQQPHIYMPFVLSSGGYLPYLKLPYYIEIFSFDGVSYVLEDTVTVNDNTGIDIIKDIPLRWHQWTGSMGMKYLGLRAFNTLFVDPFVSDPADYLPIFVSSAYEGHQTVGNTISAYVVEKTFDINSISAGYEASNPVTFSYDILYDMEFQTVGTKASGGYEASLPFESYDLISSVQTDTANIAAAGGYEASVVIT